MSGSHYRKLGVASTADSTAIIWPIRNFGSSVRRQIGAEKRLNAGRREVCQCSEAKIAEAKVLAPAPADNWRRGRFARPASITFAAMGDFGLPDLDCTAERRTVRHQHAA